jgi:hypothetical protein
VIGDSKGGMPKQAPPFLRSSSLYFSLFAPPAFDKSAEKKEIAA